MEGFISLHRKLLDWEWYTDANVMRLFIHLLLKANYEDRRWRGMVISRGQLVTSVRSLSEELKLTPSKISVALDKLKMTNEITIKTTNKNSTITVCKYDDYQDVFGSESKTKQQTKEESNRKQNTNQIENKSEQQNKYNNIIKQQEKRNTNVFPKKTDRFVVPTLDEVQAYCKERGNSVDAVRFINYYTSNGWRVGKNPMKDWRAAVRTWEQQEKNNNYNNTDNGIYQREREDRRRESAVLHWDEVTDEDMEF